jgi:hypothetical protein
MDGTESSIENSTSSVYGIHTRMAAHAALNTMYSGATPVFEAEKSQRSRCAPRPCCAPQSASTRCSWSP